MMNPPPESEPAKVQPSTEQELALALLEREQLTGMRHAVPPRRKLSRGEKLLFWALRVYVLFMLAVVAYQIIIGLRLEH